ncbi:MAG: hypothetical protein HKN95_12325 [Acidimicrobiia bacterium]|nr:hypothetical protein [Acidimicrobiia bacterium]
MSSVGSKSRITVIAFTLLMSACGTSETTTTPPADPTTPAESTTIPSTTTSTPDSTTTSTVAPTTTSTAVRTPSTEDWDIWTAILASVETGEPGGFEQAEEFASGLDGAKVLWSDDYPSLNPGYWVVYWGEFESGDEASNWCSGLPTDKACYPRYLGPEISPLATDGHALVIDGQSLVIVDVADGERLKVFDPYFEGDGMFIGRMSLTPEASAMYYGVGWEDSWYSCDASQGQLWKLDLAFGITSPIAPGYNPSVSPDGRWMAALISEQCLPDPEEPEFWVLTPTDTVVLYDLTSGWPIETDRWSVETPPTTYNDPQMLQWVDWRADSQVMLVMNNGGSVYELPLDHSGPADAGPALADGIFGFPHGVIGDTLYATVNETPQAVGTFDLFAFDLNTGQAIEEITESVGWVYAAVDTSRTRLIWGHDTQVATAETAFFLETYLSSLAW